MSGGTSDDAEAIRAIQRSFDLLMQSFDSWTERISDEVSKTGGWVHDAQRELGRIEAELGNLKGVLETFVRQGECETFRTHLLSAVERLQEKVEQPDTEPEKIAAETERERLLWLLNPELSQILTFMKKEADQLPNLPRFTVFTKWMKTTYLGFFVRIALMLGAFSVISFLMSKNSSSMLEVIKVYLFKG